MQKPVLPISSLITMSFGFFGIQMGFALQNANMSRIFQSFGADMNAIALLWIAGPVTGLIVQPIIGYMSDNSWTRFGRRRPFFLVGAILTTIALLFMPNSPYLWLAAATLWILDASLNITMEPFRAFVADMLPNRQRSAGFAVQTILIGLGGFLGSVAPWVMTNWLGVSNVAADGAIPDSVRYAFYLGAAAIFIAVMVTVLTTKEYPPEALHGFEDDSIEAGTYEELEALQEKSLMPAAFGRWGSIALAAGFLFGLLAYSFDVDKQLYVFSGAAIALGLAFMLNMFLMRSGKTDHLFSQLQFDLFRMPGPMKRLAVVQFFSWIGLFIMWIYSTPAVTAHHFGATDTSSQLFQNGADWVGWMFAIYNLFAAFYAFLIPFIARKLGLRTTHAISLLGGAAGLLSYYFISDPTYLLISMIGIGMAWGAILSLPYAMLSAALPVNRMGTYMGIFNFFIVIPQLITAAAIGPILVNYLDSQAIYAVMIGGGAFMLAAFSTLFVRGVEAK